MNVLHIIVRHKNNPHPKYPNQWLDDRRIKSIVTYPEIADLCRPLVGTDTAVRIHRTAHMSSPPVVCCETRVSAVRLSGTVYTVEFTDSAPLNLPTPIRPDGSKSYYYAEGPEKPHATNGGSQCSATVAEKGLDNKNERKTVLSLANAAQTEGVAQSEGQYCGQRSDVHAAVPVEAEAPTTETQHSGHLELLKRGIDAWNFARRSKPEVEPNLRGADLRSVLKGAYMTSINFSRTDLRDANLSGLRLYNASFVRATLRSANLAKSSWIGANVSGPESMDVRVADGYHANLSCARLDGADLSSAQLEKACLHAADFRGSNLKSANFSYSKLRGLRFDGANLQCADFRGADLTDATLHGADFRGADLSTATVTRAQLAKAKTDSTTKLPVDWDF